MNKKQVVYSAVIMLICLFVYIGCSDDPTSSGGETTTLDIVDVAEIIRDVTPPVYEAPSAALALDSFEVWTQGEWPLLEMVFGRGDPQTLDQNIYEFEFFTGMFDSLLQVDADGNIITGTYTGTVVREEQGGDSTYHGTLLVSELTSPTAIPVEHQDILGSSYDMDYLIRITVTEIPNGVVKVGFKLDSTEQSMIVHLSNMNGQPNTTSSSLTYSTLDLTDSSFIFKGVQIGSDNYGDWASSYIVSSESAGEFGYRSSWVFEDWETEVQGRAGIIGGGDKDVEFGLKYRQWIPADSTEPDSSWSFDQVFGPNYTEGTSLMTAFDEYTNDSLFIGLDDIPSATIPDPWED